MRQSDQIEWWLAQTQSTWRAVEAARETRRRPSALDQEPRSRAGRAEATPSQPSSQRVLRGATITGGMDEERRRALPIAKGESGAAAAGNSGSAPNDLPVEGGFSAGGPGQGGALGRARKLAAGYQPAVIKVVSYAQGVARATATGQYIPGYRLTITCQSTRRGSMGVTSAAPSNRNSKWPRATRSRSRH